MTIQWSRELLERHIAPGIYDFDRAVIPDLNPNLAQSESWMFDHFVNNIFGGQYRASVREQAINCIYRTQTAIRAFQKAKKLTETYLGKSKPGSPVITVYFEMLSVWEQCFLNWQMLVQVYNRLISRKSFNEGDGSIDDRAYKLANTIKHGGGTNFGRTTVPMWMTNIGFETSNSKISYVELAQLLNEAGDFVQHLIDPRSIVNSGFDSTELV